MIQKYVFGHPFETDAVVEKISPSEGMPAYGKIVLDNGFSFAYEMNEEDIVYGLGEANRGINKRGYLYISNCTDEPNHTENKHSLYGAHNFLVVSGKQTFGLFLDYPGTMKFDIGYTEQNLLQIQCDDADLDFYVIEGKSPYDIVKQFRKIIGTSYIPPKFAFGFGQSRWGYRTAEDFRNVVRGYRENHIPMDMLYMDIDYMDHYKDFTVNEEEFPDFKAFVDEMKEQKIHLIPIIDAGVKIEDGYDICEEGKEKGYFCKREDGSDFVAEVWPGWTHFPDMLNPEARKWFGEKYGRLISKGIDGFWNDMNEPAMFSTPEGVARLKNYLKEFLEEEKEAPGFRLGDEVRSLANNAEDYRSFYHQVDGKAVRHDKVHNLYGFNMTRAAGEAFRELAPGKRILMFSRASYIGMHRYGGVWMGDNHSWWSHILLNLKMLPSLNMCGFLYTGADLGGFNADTSRDLLLRWLALGVFTPLMRDHAALGTRDQECYRFSNVEDFRHVIGVRYRLLPYLYSEYMKAALRDDMLFRPLAFDFPEDPMAAQVEDQLFLGKEIMIAPVYTQNAKGRYVYLPEEMKFVKFLPDGSILQGTLERGHHYVNIALNEVPLFIRKGKKIPVVEPAECVDDIQMESMEMIGYQEGEYELYDDDGVSTVAKTVEEF
ncbi:MAG TPA: alpha-glucosidase [Candidatus Blautia excrementipullorum]|nr:alpha-glucosidase [Candidatus Blautia excrementipullorum]